MRKTSTLPDNPADDRGSAKAAKRSQWYSGKSLPIERISRGRDWPRRRRRNNANGNLGKACRLSGRRPSRAMFPPGDGTKPTAEKPPQVNRAMGVGTKSG